MNKLTPEQYQRCCEWMNRCAEHYGWAPMSASRVENGVDWVLSLNRETLARNVLYVAEHGEPHPQSHNAVWFYAQKGA